MRDQRVSAAVNLGAVALIVMLPGLALSFFDHPVFGTAAGLGALSALLATLVGGWRLGILVSIGLSLATGAALACADNVAGAALLMFLVAAATGLTARRGYSIGIVPAAITVAFVLAQPPVGSHATGGEVFDGAATMVSAGVIAVLIGSWLTRKGPIVLPVPFSWNLTINYALVLGVLAGAAAGYVVSQQTQQSGAWLIMTILVVVQPSMLDGFQKSLERSVGTLVGVVIALVIGLISLPTTVVYLIAIAFVMCAVILQAQKKAYWEVLAFLTPAIVLIVGTRGSITSTAQDRLFATLVGAGAALIVIGIESLVVAAVGRPRAGAGDHARSSR